MIPYQSLMPNRAYREQPEDGDAEGWLTRSVGLALEDMRILWWSPAVMAANYEIWDLYCTHPRGARGCAEFLSSFEIPRDCAVRDTATGEWLSGRLVDMVCPPGVTAADVAEAAAAGAGWMLRLLSQHFNDPCGTGVWGNTADTGVRRSEVDVMPGADPMLVSQVWADAITLRHEEIVAHYRWLGDCTGMCDEWDKLTVLAASMLSRQTGPLRIMAA